MILSSKVVVNFQPNLITGNAKHSKTTTGRMSTRWSRRQSGNGSFEISIANSVTRRSNLGKHLNYNCAIRFLYWIWETEPKHIHSTFAEVI